MAFDISGLLNFAFYVFSASRVQNYKKRGSFGSCIRGILPVND